jgi:hypothetical protein
VLQLKGDAAVGAVHCFPMCTPIEWSTFCTELRAKFIRCNALDLVKCEWDELSLKKGERVIEFNKHFRRLLLELDPHQPIPADILADADG